MTAVADLLRRQREPFGCRLVTLTGPGGVGKTRLALDVAATMTADFPDGVAWVPLAPIVRAPLVIPAIAQVLGIRDLGDHSLLDSLKQALRDAHLLLVLDNFEQVLDAAAPLAELLANCPGLSALVTSRALLRITGEHAFPVPPLDVPASDDDPASTQLAPSVRLFVERSRAVVPAFALTETSAPVVAAICRRLDGLPLAIELAAARSNLMPPMTLLARLDRRLPVLTGGARDLPERQRTLRGAIAWSYDLLSPEEQLVFRRLGAFVGGAPLDAAEIVCSAGDTVLDPLVLIASLVDHSLVQMAEEPSGQPRVSMLETVREFAVEQLQASDDEATTRRAHAAYFQELAANLNIWITLPDQAGALAQLEVEHANLRAALAWLWDQGESGAASYCRMCGDVFAFWWARGHLREGQGWLDRALTLTVPPAERASVLQVMSYILLSWGELDRAENLAREAAAIASAAGNHWIHSWALFVLGWHTNTVGDVVGSARYYAEALAVARNLAEPYPFQVGILNQNLAYVAFRTGDLDGAETYAREALALLEPLGERYGFGYVLRILGFACYRKGNTAEALAAWRRSLQSSSEVNDPHQIAETLSLLGRAALDTGQASLAARLLGAADIQLRRADSRMLEYHDLFDETIALTRARLGPDRFAAEWQAGSGLTPSQVWTEIEEITLDEVNPAAPGAPEPTSSSSLPHLTRREQEILALLVAGKTDREIADAQSVSVRTVEGHVAHILAKLGARTRTAAAAAAVTAGLVDPRPPTTT